jgi:hypothetical protein
MLRDPCIESDEDAIANIAMLHASLADDSPYKITRDDVRCLEVAAQSALGEGDQVLRIAAKIAALLPH